MGITEVVDTLTKIANGASSVKQIHDVGRSFSDQYGNQVKQHVNPKAMPLTIEAPPTVKVNAPVTISGTGTGLIQIYSGDLRHFEREAFCDTSGHWYTRLYFSVAGTYNLIATDYYGEATTTLVAD